MVLQFYNTLSRRKDEFTPIDAKNVRMYVCGPTVYDRPHLGNARSVVVYDVLFRLLKHIYGEKHVTYVRNITDVDDKINARAKERGVTIRSLTEEVTAQFHADMDALNCQRPTIEPRATDHIADMHRIIQQLLDNKHAYVKDGHVLFDVASVRHYSPDMGNDVQGFAYGMLSHRVQDDLQAGARVEVESYKKNPGDFVLWKPADAGDDPSSVFQSPWGAGRPGWHIECSAMSGKHLGDTFDLHGGGSDLMFPHHENEIAQSRCANDKSEFARMWVHNGFLTVNGEKMSKSLGNFITVKDLLDKGVKGEVIRLALLMAKYNEPLDWRENLVHSAKSTLDSAYKALLRVDEISVSEQVDEDKIAKMNPELALVNALTADLNTPVAISLISTYTGIINNWLNIGENKSAVKVIASRFKDSMQLLGVLQSSPQQWFKGDGDDSVVVNLIDARIVAKKAKNWAEADRIRKELDAQGILLEDKPDGTTDWRRK